MSRIDTSLGSVFSGSNVQLYKYEPFSGNTFRPAAAFLPTDKIRYTNSSSELSAFLSQIDISSVLFASAGGPTVSYSNLQLVIEDLSGSTVVQSNTYTVNIGAGRFLLPVSNTSLVFYKNEPAGNYALFKGSIPISKPVSTISLPNGLQFVSNDICSYYLTGTPTLQYPASNYTIIANGSANTSRTISVQPNITVSGERLLLDVSGTGISYDASIGVDITPIVVTGRCPPYTSGVYTGSNIRYSWTPSLPEGLRFADSAGSTLVNGGAPLSDSSSMIILRGAATNAGVRSLTSSNLDILLTGTRLSQPIISNNTTVRVVFQESIVFNEPVLRPLYRDASINSSSSSNSFFAFTKFASSGGGITNITSSNLPTGVYLDFSSNASRAYLVGTPTAAAGTYVSTIRASNSNGRISDISATLTLVTDSITFSSSTDPCSTFIIGRSLSNAKTGYYSSPIRFVATAGSGCNVTMSITNLSGTGLTFTGSNGNYLLSGTPTGTKTYTTAVVTANVAATSKTATQNFNFVIVPDTYTFQDVSLSLIENFPITPVTVVASNVSELPIIRYASANIPAGLTIAPNGKISGTPRTSDTSGTFTVFATSGVTSGTSSNFRYTLIPDSILLTVPQSTYSYVAGDTVDIPVTGLAYSGATVSNYQFNNFPSSGLTIGSTSGLISGTLGNSIPQNPVFPAGTTSFDVCAGTGTNLDGHLGGTFTTSNPVLYRSFLFTGYDALNQVTTQLFTNDISEYQTGWRTSNVTYIDSGSSNNGLSIDSTQVSAFDIKNTSVTSNVFMATTASFADTRGRILRSTNGFTFSNVYLRPSTSIQTVIASSIARNVLGTSISLVLARDTAQGGANTLSRVYAYRSLNDGVTWSPAGSSDGVSALVSDGKGGTVTKYLWPRDKDNLGSTTLNAYLLAGTTLAFQRNIAGGGNYFLAGGRGDASGGISLMTSPNGSTWSIPTTPPSLTTEIAAISTTTDASGLILATGSSLYTTQNRETYTTAANTISWSVPATAGNVWSNVDPWSGGYTDSSGQFNYIGYDVTPGNGCWVATGLSYLTTTEDALSNGYYPEVRVAAFNNPTRWYKVPFFNSHTTGQSSFGTDPYPLQIGSIMYDSSGWRILVSKNTGGSSVEPYLATHAPTAQFDALALTSNWSIAPISSLIITNSNVQFYRGFSAPIYVQSNSPVGVSLFFSNTSSGGPTFTGPSQTTYVVYQYMPITPITFTATGSGTVYFFIQSEDLPTGLTWDPYTATIRGKTVNVGSVSLSVYARDNNGVTALNITIQTVIPRVIRQQTSAGAYTYLVKQYTEVNAAQNARDNRVNPTQDAPLGKFMAPPAPDVTSPSNCKKC